MRKLIFGLTSFLLLPGAVFAGTLSNAFDNTTASPLNTVGDKAGYVVSNTTVDPIIQNVIAIVLSFLGVIFLVLTIYAGYLWMTAQGDKAQIEKAKDIITRAVIGLIVVISAYALSSYVITSFADQGLTSTASGLQ